MEQALRATREHFESSSSHTIQYLAWHKLFKREFTAYLERIGAVEIQIGKPNHFDMSGFFKMRSGQIWYFSIGDLRWNKDRMLIRTAKDFKDYTGGMNQYVSLEDYPQFEMDMRKVV